MSCNHQCLTINESEDGSEGPVTESSDSLIFRDDQISHSELDTRRGCSAGESRSGDRIIEGSRQNNAGHFSLGSYPFGPQFSFIADSLSLRRNVNRHIDLEEMQNVKYMCAGSNSHIFSATWKDKPVIVKVTWQFCT